MAKITYESALRCLETARYKRHRGHSRTFVWRLSGPPAGCPGSGHGHMFELGCVCDGSGKATRIGVVSSGRLIAMLHPGGEYSFCLQAPHLWRQRLRRLTPVDVFVERRYIPKAKRFPGDPERESYLMIATRFGFEEIEIGRAYRTTSKGFMVEPDPEWGEFNLMMPEPSVKPQVPAPQGDLILDRLGEVIPDLNATVNCPECEHDADADDGRVDSLASTVIHLNDDHAWPREAIADWLDRLMDQGWDLTFRVPPNLEQTDRPRSLA